MNYCMLAVVCTVLFAPTRIHAESTIRDVRLQWLVPEDADEVSGYVLYRKRGTVEERIELGPGVPSGSCERIRSATVGFLRSGAYTLTLTAISSGEESERSAPLKLPSCRAQEAAGCKIP